MGGIVAMMERGDWLLDLQYALFIELDRRFQFFNQQLPLSHRRFEFFDHRCCQQLSLSHRLFQLFFQLRDRLQLLLPLRPNHQYSIANVCC